MPALDVALACRGPGGSRLDPGALASLDLRGKGVNAVAPSLGSHLTGLAKLDLADNVLGNDCVGALASLVTLKHLSVANNSLNGDALRPWLGAASAAAPPGKKRRAEAESAPRATARRGKHSEHFKKDNTSGDAWSSTHGVVFPKMRVLNVSGNGLVSVSGVAAARNLGALIANENKITSLRHVDALRDLNTLVASSNDIDEIGDEFSKLINLNKLSLSHNKLKTVGDALAQCAALRELRLARNEITALPRRALAGCAQLRILDLSGNAFKDFGDVEALKFLPKLQQLSMRGSPLSRNARHYDATVAKMCPSLKTLDGRRVGPGGWLDAPSEKDKNREKKPAPRPDADAWADARAAAGLDPLEASERPAGGEEAEELRRGNKPSPEEDESGSAYDDDDDDDDDGDDGDDDDSDDSEEMDDEEREMMAEVRALRASMRAEEHAKKGGERREAKRGRDDEADGDEDPGAEKEKHNPGRVSAAPGAEGTSFLQELVARNVGSVRGTLGVGGEDGRGPSAGGKTDGEKLAAATRSGVVKIVEVKKKKRRDGDEMSRKQNVVATGRDALLALLGDGAEAAGDGDGAWGGGGWGLEEEKADAEEDEERRRKKTKTRASLDDAGARDVATLKVFSSEKKKKKEKRRDADDFDDFDARLGASAKKKKREDDPWNDDESKRRRKQAMLSKKKKKQNVLARRYKK
jgi:hypothetical protein